MTSGEEVSRDMVLAGNFLKSPQVIFRIVAACIILLALYAISLANYLLFHGIVEVAAIAVAFAIFFLVWNTRRVKTDSFFLLIGIAFLFIGVIDLLHMLAYKGMGVFPGNSADLPTQLWLAARYFQGIVFFIAALLIGKSLTKDRKYDPVIFFAACAAGTGLLLLSIFSWQDFPHAFIDGSGLTPFKIASEYVISAFLLGTIVLLVLKRDYFDRNVWYLLIAAQSFLIAGELAFTSYASVYGFMNMIGHLFRLVSVYFFYEAIVVVGLTRPSDILFRELTSREAELRKSEELLRRSEQHYRNLVDLCPDTIFVNRKNRIVYLNPAGLELFGASSPDQVLGKSPLDLFHPDYHATVRSRIDKHKEGSTVTLIDEKIVRLDGTVRDVEVAAHPFVDDEGPAIEVILRDVTERKLAERELMARNEDLNVLNEELTSTQEELRQTNDELVKNEQWLISKNEDLIVLNEELIATQDELHRNVTELLARESELEENKKHLEHALDEKEILLAEVHHRVKNNLSAFISLLSLEGSYEDSPSGIALRKDLQNRARSMALIHETLYKTKEFSRVDMDVYLRTLVEQIAGSYNPRVPVTGHTDAHGLSLDLSRATPCGLIINELVTNSFKYAFPESFDCTKAEGGVCSIGVTLAQDEGAITLTIKDNGIGMPAGFDIKTTQSLGLKLVNFLARHQLRATVEIDSSSGTESRIRFGEAEK